MRPFIFLFAICFADIISGQGIDTLNKLSKADTIELLKAKQLNSKEFDLWIKNGLKELSKLDKPIVFEIAIKERMKNDIFTSDSAIIISIDAWIRYDWNRKIYSFETKSKAEKFRAPPYINELIEIIYGREGLKTTVLLKKMDVIHNHMWGDCDYEYEYNRIIKILEPSDWSLDYKRMNIFFNYAWFLKREGNIALAEKYFNIILSYPYYTVGNEKYKNLFFDLYLSAGKGVIVCRAKDKVALEGTYFVPAARNILDPIKNKAIEDLNK